MRGDDRLTVRFPAALRQRLRDMAHRSGTRESDLVREAVEKHVEIDDNALTAYEHAKKAGLIGAVRKQNGIPVPTPYISMALANLNGRVLIDTGPIVAMLSKSDQHHEACVKQLRSIRGPLLTCWPVITEAAWLLRAYPQAVGKLLSSFCGRPFELASLNETDLTGIAAILVKYKGLGIQLADASLVHLANREEINIVFTLDRRDFEILRMSDGRKFRLIP